MLNEIWTAILEATAQVIIPVWNDLIAFLPLVVGLLFLGILGALAYLWIRHAGDNRSRVPKPIPAGRQPEDMHLPGPSAWPFVAPVGLLLIVFSVALGVFDSLWTIGLLLGGLAVVGIGIIGWYLDAKKEYVAVEAGTHGMEGEAAELPGWSLTPPEGMHLPGPSAWPLLAPVGLLFTVSGLLFGPAMLVGGLIMSVVAVIGWLGDANKELDDVEEHGHPTQADRDPEKAWPGRLMPVYYVVGAGAIILTLLPWLVSLLPGSGS
ncbi:MAG: hypothetical protein PVG27_09735 [Chloroflexota bacterium]